MLFVLVRPTPWRWNGVQWRAAALLGFALSGLNGFFYVAVDRIPLGIAVALEFLGPLVLAAVLSRKLSQILWVLLAATGIAALGVDASLGVDDLDLWGAGAALLAGAFWALYIIATAKVGTVHHGMEGLPVATLIGGLILLPLGISGAAGLLNQPELWFLLIPMALFSSVVPISMELGALRRIDRELFSILVATEPIFATFFGWLLLHQTVGPLRLAAIGLIMIAMAGITAQNVRLARKQADVIRAETASLPVLPSPPDAIRKSRNPHRSSGPDHSSQASR